MWGQLHKPHAADSSAVDAVRLRRVNRWMAQGPAGELAHLYVDSHKASDPEAYRSRSHQDYLNCLTGDIRRPTFAMVIAETDSLAECAIGFPVHSDGFWRLGFDAALPLNIEQRIPSGAVFAITGILVSPYPHDEDVACRLQERLLRAHQASVGVTLVNQNDHPTLAALRSWGWLGIGEVWRPTEPPMFRALVLPLGERTAARLAGLVRDDWTRWPG